uniref:Secreted protein n=1 Tax=Panagrellus redivivus TaxID=6233 RepID=A0A7E4UMQ4_PANRE
MCLSLSRRLSTFLSAVPLHRREHDDDDDAADVRCPFFAAFEQREMAVRRHVDVDSDDKTFRWGASRVDASGSELGNGRTLPLSRARWLHLHAFRVRLTVRASVECAHHEWKAPRILYHAGAPKRPRSFFVVQRRPRAIVRRSPWFA